MTREEMIAVLESLPAGTEVLLVRGDNAWPPLVRQDHGDKVAYICVDTDKANEHRNFHIGEVFSRPVEPPKSRRENLKTWKDICALADQYGFHDVELTFDIGEVVIYTGFGVRRKDETLVEIGEGSEERIKRTPAR